MEGTGNIRSIGLFVGLLFAAFPASVSGQRIYSGRVVDTYTKSPVQGAEVSVLGTNIRIVTDATGSFSFTTEVGNLPGRTDYQLVVIDDKVHWRSEKKIDISVFSILGQETGVAVRSLSGSGVLGLGNTAPGIYLLNVTCAGNRQTFKLIKGSNSLAICREPSSDDTGRGSSLKTDKIMPDTLVITKEGYYIQKYVYKGTDEVYELLKLRNYNVDYLDRIIRPEAFTLLQGLPLNPTFGEVKSVKLVYSIPDEKMYYSNSEKYFIHYDFCAQVLGYSKGHSMFNREQYTKNASRIYILASLSHFT